MSPHYEATIVVNEINFMGDHDDKRLVIGAGSAGVYNSAEAAFLDAIKRFLRLEPEAAGQLKQALAEAPE